MTAKNKPGNAFQCNVFSARMIAVGRDGSTDWCVNLMGRGYYGLKSTKKFARAALN